MQIKIDVIADYDCTLGENPIWHSDEQALYWLDIVKGRIFRYTPADNYHEQVYQSDVIGGMTIQTDGSFILFMAEGRIAHLKDGTLTTLIEPTPDHQGMRFNDVIATPSGAVFCGTLADERHITGTLYRLNTDLSMDAVVENIGIANGMGFSTDLNYFYFTDSEPARIIYRFRYDPVTAIPSEQITLIDVPEAMGVPDGMTVDADGFLWSACWDGSQLIRYMPDGQIDRTVAIPASKKITSVAFGGADYRDLYVTTAGGDDKSANGDNAGALFRLRIEGIKGRAEYRSMIDTHVS